MNKLNVIKKKDKFLIDKKTFQHFNSKGFGFESNGVFYLNIYEVLFLLEKNKIILLNKKNKNIEYDILLKSKKFNMDEYLVYKDLKKKGFNVRTGLKFGTSFRLYDKGIKPGEDHSLWLVEVLNEKEKMKLKELILKNRIAHSTNKKLIIAIIDDENEITYLENSWKRL